MMGKEPKPGRKAAIPGPKPKLLRLRENWKAAIKRSLAKKKPSSGWPK
jgi:hypothetical protein